MTQLPFGTSEIPGRYEKALQEICQSWKAGNVFCDEDQENNGNNIYSTCDASKKYSSLPFLFRREM